MMQLKLLVLKTTSAGGRGLHFFDPDSIPIDLVGVGKTSQNDTHGVALFGNGQYALTADRSANTIDCWDISDPTSPTLLSSVSTAQTVDCHYVTVGPNELYAYTGADGYFTVIDISNPNAIAQHGFVQLDVTGDTTQQVVVLSTDDYAYVAYTNGDAVYEINISDKANPAVNDSISGAGAPNYLNSVAHLTLSADEDTLYAASYTDHRVVSINIATPGSMVLRDTIATNIDSPHEMEIKGNYLFVACMYESDRNKGALVVLDISDPDNLAYVTQILMDGTDPNNTYYLDRLHDLSLSGNYLYGSSQLRDGDPDPDWGNALTKFDVTDPTNPSVVWSWQHHLYLAGAQEVAKYGDYLFVACHEWPALTVWKEN